MTKTLTKFHTLNSLFQMNTEGFALTNQNDFLLTTFD